MPVYLIAYEFPKNVSEADRLELHRTLESLGPHCRPLDSVWFVETNVDRPWLDATIRRYTFACLVVEVEDIDNVTGAVHKDCADWLNEHLDE